MNYKFKTNRAMMAKICLLTTMIFLLLGCGQTNAPAFVATVTATQTVTALPTEGEAQRMTQLAPTPANPTLQALITKAKDDLAQRLSVPVDQINLVQAEEVEWSDSSLGCPQPGMFYTQVITLGFRIVLENNGNQYEYHTNRDTYIIYCENSLPPNP